MKLIQSNPNLQGNELLIKEQGQDLGFIINTIPPIYVKYTNEDSKKIEYRDFENISRLLNDISVRATTYDLDTRGLFVYSQAISNNCRDLSRIMISDFSENQLPDFRDSLLLNFLMGGLAGLHDIRSDNISVDQETARCVMIDFSEYPSEDRYLNTIHFNLHSSFKETFLELIININKKLETEGSLENDGTIDLISKLLGDDEEQVKTIARDAFKKIREMIIKYFENLQALKETNAEAYKKGIKILKTNVAR